jgi:hypothetical protein
LVPVKVFGLVLTFAIEVIRWLGQDPGASGSRPFAVSRRIVDSYLDNDGVIRHKIAFGNSEAPLTRKHLNTMIANAQPHAETEGFAQPFRRDARVRVDKNRYYRTGRNGTVVAHC